MPNRPGLLSRCALHVLLLLAVPLPALGVGFQLVQVSDPAAGAIPLGLWYPSDAPRREQAIGPYTQRVAPDGAVRGTGLPLVLISHGTGGTLAAHHGTALALAEAGYVVAALTHPGDSLDDMAEAGSISRLPDRPRHFARAMDYVLQEWSERGRIDRNRIGAFGHGMGGFTVLVAAGGTPGLQRIRLHCHLQPADSSCRLWWGDVPASAPGWARATGMRAIVVAAPSHGYLFVPDGLKDVSQPVQLWRPTFDETLMHPWHAEQIRFALPNAPLYGEVAGASHYAFIAPCPDALTARLPEVCLDTPGFDRPRFHREFNAALVSFFNTSLR